MKEMLLGAPAKLQPNPKKVQHNQKITATWTNLPDAGTGILRDVDIEDLTEAAEVVAEILGASLVAEVADVDLGGFALDAGRAGTAAHTAGAAAAGTARGDGNKRGE